jgi:hypothetical protein
MEVAVVTAANGGYSFANLEPGTVRIDVHIPNEGTPNAAWAVTAPAFREVQVNAGANVINQNFGLENRAGRDWGDLPNSFVTLRNNVPEGPSHQVVQGFRLGSGIDGEVDGVPSPTATGDDSVGDTDDGVRVVSNGGILMPGVNLLEVTVFGFGGMLTGWIDWNKNGSFQPNEKIIWRDEDGNVLGDEADIVQGTFTLQVIAPAGMADGFLGARFRWGEPGLDFFGPAMIGEVEDYFFTGSTVPLSGLAGDYNNDGTVEAGDYLVWRKFLGTNIYLANDTTPGSVTEADYDVWAANLGMMAGAGAASEPLAASSEADSAPAALDSGDAADFVVVSLADSSAATIAEPALSTTSPLAVDLAMNGSASTSFDAATDFVEGDTSASAATDAGANLLLLDQALAELDDSEDEEPLYDRFRQDDESVGDLELAAVFEGETEWWSV